MMSTQEDESLSEVEDYDHNKLEQMLKNFIELRADNSEDHPL